ncbi:hypothetical protein FBU59_001873 [Linderina macrospora]|uniref:Uncharacterized protein n=1 Tax=Linderina macrospora TaxID=4868 RepID=A0ACC1JD16_9FUNG|nr:hypothetical protein FBU59_001873 [Linderina macrospora]
MARCAALVESPDAAELYEEVVKLQPNAVEAYAFLNAARGSVAVPTPYVAGGEAYGAVQGLAVARSLVARLAYAQAIDEIQRLVRRHGNVASLVALQATCHYMLNDGRRAQALYMKARKLDPSLMVEMGTYADLLRTTTTDDNEHKLYELGSALLQTDQTRAEGWTTMARYLLLRGQLQEALAISWKAQALAPGSADAFYIEGVIQMAAVCPEEAADAFLKAHMLARNALTYRGIVDAYLACARYKDAFVVAKEAAELMPAHAQTLTMVGKVLSHSADTHEKAAELLRMALREDRRCADAVDALASLYAATGRHDEAIAVMDEFLAENPSDALHAKLADILTLADQLPRAAENYAVALDINPGNERARVGLNRVDRLMNPDAQHLQDGGNGEEEDEIGEPIDEPLPPSDQDDEMMLAMMRGEQGDIL